MKKHYFEPGETVFFLDRMNLFASGEIIATHGPWLWIDDGGGLHTVHCDDADYEPENVPEERPEAIW